MDKGLNLLVLYEGSETQNLLFYNFVHELKSYSNQYKMICIRVVPLRDFFVNERLSFTCFSITELQIVFQVHLVGVKLKTNDEYSYVDFLSIGKKPN